MLETEPKIETEVDLPFEEEEKKQEQRPSTSSHEVSQSPQHHLSLDLKIKEQDFQVKAGCIRGFLYQASQSGSTFKNYLVWKGMYVADTVQKQFSLVKDNQTTTNEFEKMNFGLQQFTIVDTDLLNPENAENFQIANEQVQLPPEFQFPFAVLYEGKVNVFWTQSLRLRELWVRALKVISENKQSDSQGGDSSARTLFNKIVTSEDNWYSSQIYVFIKREFQMKQAIQAASATSHLSNADNEGESGGAERAANEYDEMEKMLSKQIKILGLIDNCQTVTSDDTFVKGYLYKTAQSMGLMGGKYFIRRYYVLNKKTKLLTIHENSQMKADHTLQLEKILLKTETRIRKFLKPDYIQHFKDDVKNLKLPKDNPLPFALFIKNQVSLLWATTNLDYKIWTQAFQEIQIQDVTSNPPQIKPQRKNRFVTSLLAALRTYEEDSRNMAITRGNSMDARQLPTKEEQKETYRSSTLAVEGKVFSGLMTKTAQRLFNNFPSRQKEYFHQRQYSLCTSTGTMHIKRVDKNPYVKINLLEDGNRIIEIDTNLSNKLVVNHLDFFKKQLQRELITPQDFIYPFFVRMQNDQMMLLWAKSDSERSIWAGAFQDLMQQCEIDQMKQDSDTKAICVPKLQANQKNEFIVTMYKCLVPAKGAQGLDIDPTAEIRIRIKQQGLLMKTSQKQGGFMQTKCFHLRFFQLNISTGLLKVFEKMGPETKVKHQINLRQNLIKVTQLNPKFRKQHNQNMKKLKNFEESMFPHDFKYPFAIVYKEESLGDQEFKVMLFWSDSIKNLKDWCDAFEYIKIKYQPTEKVLREAGFNKNVILSQFDLDDLLVANKSNSFSVILYKCLEPCEPDKLSQIDQLPNKTEENASEGSQKVAANRSSQQQQQEQQIEESKQNIQIQKQDKTPPQKMSLSSRKRMMEDELIEQCWVAFKTQTPVENLISGQGTFQIQPNYSMGLIRARKELFDNNYDPDTIVSCFLIIDFNKSLIGIRSVDKGFSAMVRFDMNELVRIQDNDFDIHDQSEDSQRMTNTIDLVMACKAIQISPNHPSEKSMIVNELNRAKLIQEMPVNSSHNNSEEKAQVKSIIFNNSQKDHQSSELASNQQQIILSGQRIRVNSQAKKLSDQLQQLGQSNEDEDEQKVSDHDAEEVQTWSNTRRISDQHTDEAASQRTGRFNRDSLQQSRKLRLRESYASRGAVQDNGSQRDFDQANNQQDQQQQQQQQQIQHQKEMNESQPEIIPLKRIKFSKMKLQNDSATNSLQDPFLMTQKLRQTNSFFNDNNNNQDSNQNEALKQQSIESNQFQQSKEQTTTFYQSLSSMTRQAHFKQSKADPQAAPIVLKLRKKKTEDSLVRDSLHQSIKLNQTVGRNKIDFHGSHSFRDSFAMTSKGVGAMRAIRPPVNYDEKIASIRNDDFIENLIQQDLNKVNNGNRFMSPAIQIQNNDQIITNEIDKLRSQQGAADLTQQPIINHTPHMSESHSKHDFMNLNFKQQDAPQIKQFTSNQQDDDSHRRNQDQTNQQRNTTRQQYSSSQQPQLTQTQPVNPQILAAATAHDIKSNNDVGGDLSDWDSEDSGDGQRPNFSMTQQLQNLRGRQSYITNKATAIIAPRDLSMTSNVYHGHHIATHKPGHQGWTQQTRNKAIPYKRANSHRVDQLEVEDWD